MTQFMKHFVRYTSKIYIGLFMAKIFRQKMLLLRMMRVKIVFKKSMSALKRHMVVKNESSAILFGLLKDEYETVFEWDWKVKPSIESKVPIKLINEAEILKNE